MEEALVALLLADSGVTAKLSSRLWWGRAPQSNDTYPYAVLQRVTGQRDYHMTAPSGYVESRVQIDVYDEKRDGDADSGYQGVKLAARAIMNALDGYRGTQSSIAFQGIFIDAERDLPAVDAGEVTHLHRTSIDIFVHHDQ